MSRLFPAAGLACEASRQGRRSLGLGFRFGFARCGPDLRFERRVVWKAGDLVHEHERVLRGDLELLPASLARDVVVDAEEIVAQLFERDAVGVIDACLLFFECRTQRMRSSSSAVPSECGTHRFVGTWGTDKFPAASLASCQTACVRLAPCRHGSSDAPGSSKEPSEGDGQDSPTPPELRSGRLHATGGATVSQRSPARPVPTPAPMSPPNRAPENAPSAAASPTDTPTSLCCTGRRMAPMIAVMRALRFTPDQAACPRVAT